MCGRAYETYTDEELEMRYLNKKVRLPTLKDFKCNYNMAPTQTSPVVLVQNEKRTIDLFRWGLVPGWAKDIKSAAKYSLINARGEEITDKRSYSGLFKKRRCIIPISGFFEWKRTKDNKRPFAISDKDDGILSVAGIWEHWVSKDDGEEVNSFSIITTSANSLMEKIHDRMPVILNDEALDEWLDPENQDTVKLQKLLKPCPAHWLKAVEVTTMVNSVKNNKREVLDPI